MPTISIHIFNFRKSIFLICLFFSSPFLVRSQSVINIKRENWDSIQRVKDSIQLELLSKTADSSYNQRNNFFAIEFTEGTIRFSGANFRNVETVRFTKGNLSKLHSVAVKCGRGSIITLENVYYKNEKREIIGPIYKTINL